MIANGLFRFRYMVEVQWKQK